MMARSRRSINAVSLNRTPAQPQEACSASSSNMATRPTRKSYSPDCREPGIPWRRHLEAQLLKWSNASDLMWISGIGPEITY